MGHKRQQFLYARGFFRIAARVYLDRGFMVALQNLHKEAVGRAAFGSYRFNQDATVVRIDEDFQKFQGPVGQRKRGRLYVVKKVSRDGIPSMTMCGMVVSPVGLLRLLQN